MDHAWRGSSSASPRMDDDDARLVHMCPSLYRAVHGGRTEEVLALLQHHGATAPHTQCDGIIQHGPCDILEASAEGNTILHVAAEKGHDHLIGELCLRFREKKGLLSRRNSALDTPLNCAARARQFSLKVVSVLVQLTQEHGEDVLGCKNQAGDTALHLAARHGHGAAVEVLTVSAAATEPNNAGVSALYLAVMSGSVQAVRAIIATCRDASAAGPSGQNALHAAVFRSSEMVELLLEWRAALANEVDCNGSTPLHFASSDGKVRADLLNNDGHTPFDLVEKSTSFLTLVNLVLVLVVYGAQSRPQRQDYLKPWGGRDIGLGIEKVSDSLAVVAGLIVTITFTAGFQVPGSYGDDGTANLKDKRAFKFFMVFNSLAAAASVVTVFLLVYGKVSRSAGSWKSFAVALHSFWMSLNLLMLAFYAATAAVWNAGNHLVFLIVYMAFQALIFSIMLWIAPKTKSKFTICRYLWRSPLNTRQHAIIKRQYPFAAASLYNFVLFRVLNCVVAFGIGFVFGLTVSGTHNA